MTNAEYIAGALRTEAPVTEELQARLRVISTLHWLKIRVPLSIVQAQHMDDLKKHIFYGKSFSEFSTHRPYNPPDMSDVERATDPNTIRLLHAAIGIFTEAGEVLDALYGHIFSGSPLDLVNLFEEGGDVFWYMAILADALGVTFEQMQETNIAKLRARYPEKFNEGRATVRDLPAERQILEDGDGR